MFKPGDKRPENAGRRKGTPNKASLKLLDQLLEKNINPVEEILKLMDLVDANKKMDAWLKLLSYCYPTLKAIEVQGEGGTVIGVTPDNVALLCNIARQEALASIKEKDVG